MDNILMKIQDTAVKYADIISQIARVDVEVVDAHLFRVAGTGIFSDKINEDMSSEGYVYNKVLETGLRQIIYEPGREDICQACPHCNACSEEIEISMPVRLDDEIIGIIGLVGTSKEQKERITKDETLYLEFLEQIADFISTKAREYVELENKNILLGTLDCTISHIEQGILILGKDGVISAANASARHQLETSLMEGSKARIAPTGDHVSNRIEYTLQIGSQEYEILGHMFDFPRQTKEYASVVIFDSKKNVQNRCYEMTTTVHTLDSSNIIGSSVQTLALKDKIRKVAQSFSTVLITGESGTGKEMVATAIWNASNRKEGKFVAINCAAIPEPLLESELFGYVKGAFTGADPNGRIGKFELANKGIIFLDEIGDMPLYLQAKLLRVIQERKIIRIGSNQVIPIDVRIIAATNKNLKEMIREKRFREDLYYRLNVIPMEITPLRERKEDIEELACFFAKRYADLFGKQYWKITDSVVKKLQEYPWEGNVRELENVLEFMINMMDADGVLDDRTLPRDFYKEGTDTAVQRIANQDEPDETILTLKELEHREICKALARYGNTTQGKREAAKHLGIGLATLYRKMEEM